jgi:hypothetical protein
VVALPPAARLDAQEALPCEAGDRIRVSAPMLRDHTVRIGVLSVAGHGLAKLWLDRSHGRVIAAVIHASPDTLTVEPVPTHARVEVPWDSIRVLEVSLGQMPRGTFVARTALVGAAANATFWGLNVALLGDDDDCGWGPCLKKRDWPMVALVMGGLGGGMGALVGMILPSPERWQQVSLPGTIAAEASADGRIAIRLARQF